MHKLILVLSVFLMVGFVNVFIHPVCGAQDSNSLQVIVNTTGNFNVDWFSVHYTAGPDVKSSFSLDFNTSEEIAPYITVEMRYDKSQYSNDKPVFNPAELIIWGSSFEKNGTKEDFIFSGAQSYHYFFNSSIDYYPNGPSSGQNLCTYSFELSRSLVDAQTKLATFANLSEANQSNMRCIIDFEISHLNQGISYNGQQQQLQLDCIMDSFRVKNFMFDITLPDNYYFLNTQTLNGEDMYGTPNRVMGVAQNNYGYDSQGNPFWPNTIVVNWQIPITPQIWEAHPYDWIISSLVGVLLSAGCYAIWNRFRKPNLQVTIVKHPWIHPQSGMAFYRLTVTNTGKNTAHDCAIHINFRTSKNRPLFSLVGKWDSLPEPLGPMSQNQQVQVWPSIIPLSEKQSIRHRQSDTFCLAIKDNTFFCYAFNAQSYLHPKFQNPLWQLQTGNYFVEIELIADNAQKKCDFKLSNKGNTIYDLYLSSLKA